MNDWIFYVILGVLVLVFVAMIVTQSRKRRTAQAEYAGMLETLRPGMRVKTVGGVIGKIREIREEAPGFKTVMIETGDAKNPSLVTYDLQAIYGIVDDEAILAQKAANEQAKAIQNHQAPDNRVNNPENVFETKKGKTKRNK